MSDSGASTTSNASRRRTRTGCITCRIRRVKCDEAKPECKRCVQSKRKCDGYGPAQTAQLSRRELTEAMRRLAAVGPASRVLAAGPQQAGDVTACFDYFRARTAPTAGTFLPSGFWDSRFLQLAHAEPALWSAAAALGSLHRRWETLEVAREQSTQFAEQASVCYGRAMALAKDIRDPWALLVLSVALVAVSNLSGRYVDSRVHLASGQRLLELVKKESPGSIDEVEDVTDSLIRMDLEGASFSDASAPYLYGSVDGSEGISSTSNCFKNLNQPAMRLLALIREFLNLAGQEPWVPTPEDFAASKIRALAAEKLQAEVALWEGALMTHLSLMSPAQQSKSAVTLLWLKLHHAFMRLLLKATLSGPETRWDACLPHFERIIALSAGLISSTQSLVPWIVTLDPGLVMPLYMCVSRCRHPVVRRRALALLRRANRQEGVWHSVGCAAVGEAILGIEEEGTGIDTPPLIYLFASDLDRWGDGLVREEPGDWLNGDHGWLAKAAWEDIIVVPERNRCIDTVFAANVDEHYVHLTIIFSGADDDDQPRTRKTFVTF